MRRDDADRLLIVGGLLWLWFAPAVAQVISGPASSPYPPLGVGYVPLVILSLVQLGLAALLLWRNIARVRPLLIAAALIEAVAAIVALVANTETPIVVALVAIASLLVAVGAARVRVPAPRRAEPYLGRVDRGNQRRAAMPALLDAAAAILLRDRLADDDREILAGPWESAVAAAPAPV